MADSSKAVFLSYASQDAAAAKRICEALRSAGVEVWFDQSELRGGDAWDGKIRKQIKDCALFVPVISATTQQRHEGYFRLEWRLADQRTHLMGKARAFLVPVCIDDTRDAEADVPDSFTAVQWTRLAGGEGAAPFGERVKALLDGEVAQASRLPVEKNAGGTPALRPRHRLPGWVWVTAIAALIALAIWRPWRMKDAGAPPAAASAAKVNAVASFPRDPELQRAWNLLQAANDREELALAEDIVKTAVARQTTDPETVIVYAWLNNGYINRGFDTTEERYLLGRRYAERAKQLAPDEPEALAALGQFLSFRGADLPRSEQLLRRAIELKPDEPRFHRALAWNALRTLRPVDALIAAERSAALFPRNALVQYELGMLYNDAGRLDDMERAFDRTLEIAPIGGAVIWKAWLAGWVHGDIAGMKRLVEQIPADTRLTSRAVVIVYQCARLTGDPNDESDALRGLQAFPGTWMNDFWFTGPKALMIGELFAAQGKPELARGQFESALAEVTRQKAASPADPKIRAAEGWALIGLGRPDEARAAFNAWLGLPRAIGPRLAGWWTNVIPAALLLGDRALALQELRRIAEEPALRMQVRVALRVDPRMAPFRDDAEIAALVVEAAKPAVTTAAPAPDPKSVVVLPFANRSGDPAQEYFSDGITEEILNALARERDLRVVPRASAFSFKGKNLSLPEIARALNVAQVIDGSVRRDGNVVRIDCTLTRVAGEFTESLPRFEREMRNAGDIFALQDEVAGAVVEKLTQRKVVAARAAVVTQVPEAYDAYMLGRQLLTETSPSWNRAVAALDQAVKLDPKFALAWATLARAHAQLYALTSAGAVQSFHVPAGRAAVETALRLQPNLAEAHLAQALLLSGDGTNLAAALRELDLAEQNRPDNSEIILVRAQFAIQQGQRAAAIDLTRRAAVLDPRNGMIANQLGNFLRVDGRYGEAEKAYELAFGILGSSIPRTNQALNAFQWQGDRARVTRLLEAVPAELRLPGYWAARQFTLYELGDLRGALSAFDAVDRRSGLALLIAARAREELGEGTEAERLYRTLLETAEKERAEMPASLKSWSLLALTYAGLGRKDEALAAAKKGLEVVPPTENPYLASGGTSVAAYVGYVALAQVQARFGLTEEALAIVQAQAAAGWWRRNYLLLSPDWNVLRKDPRFRAIAEKAPL